MLERQVGLTKIVQNVVKAQPRSTELCPCANPHEARGNWIEARTSDMKRKVLTEWEEAAVKLLKVEGQRVYRRMQPVGGVCGCCVYVCRVQKIESKSRHGIRDQPYSDQSNFVAALEDRQPWMSL